MSTPSRLQAYVLRGMLTTSVTVVHHENRVNARDTYDEMLGENLLNEPALGPFGGVGPVKAEVLQVHIYIKKSIYIYMNYVCVCVLLL